MDSISVVYACCACGDGSLWPPFQAFLPTYTRNLIVDMYTCTHPGHEHKPSNLLPTSILFGQQQEFVLRAHVNYAYTHVQDENEAEHEIIMHL